MKAGARRSKARQSSRKREPAATDTIAAVATPAGRGAVGIVRLSGPRAFDIAARIAGKTPAPRHAALRDFRDASGAALDRGLVLAFPAPGSYTGEDVVELQGHGGPVVLDLVLRACCAAGARVAQPGEFSERAFVNGRMDLAQAEAIADLINAGTAQAARAAQRSMDGEFSRRVTALVEEVTQLRMFVEGALDFSDEDVDWLSDEKVRARLDALIQHLAALLAEASQGRRLSEGLTAAIAGQPNVGKSTLMNRLSRTETAIVTAIPGTTRDLLRENIDLDGLPLTLVDTAGLRASKDPVERIGIERAWHALERAELVLFVVDDRAGVTAADRKLLGKIPSGREIVLVRNKCDLSRRAPGRAGSKGPAEIRVAAKSGAGISLLVREIKRAAGLAGGGETSFSARTRHVEALRRALACARDAQLRLAEGATPELAAEELKLSQQALAEITGAFTPEDLLTRIFAGFCIGK